MDNLSQFKYTDNSEDADDPIVKLNETYINSTYPKLRASGYVFFAQRHLRKSPPDYQEAIKLWLKALTLSAFTNPIALYNFGVHQYLGKGIDQNYKKALSLFEKAGHAGNYLYGCRNFGVKESSFAAGKCLEDGTGSAKDIDKAGEWYYESYRCDQGYGPAGIKYAKYCHEHVSTIGDAEFIAKRIMDSTSMWGNVPDDHFPLEFLVNFECPLPNTINTPNTSNSKYWIHEKEIRLKAEAIKGGFSANLRNSMNNFAQGLYAMASYFDAVPNNAHRENVDLVQHEIIHHIASAFRCIEDVSTCQTDNWQKFQKFVTSNLSHPLNDMSVTSALDRDARICKLMEMITCPNSVRGSVAARNELLAFFKFLKQSKSKYPTELFFHQMCLFLAKDNELAFGDVAGLDLESTIKIFPNHPDILYSRAVLISNRSVDQSAKENAYLDFINVAPMDHKYLPDTFYRLAELYGKCNNLEQCQAYYEKGVQAEKNLLSFYLPYKSAFKMKMISIQATLELGKLNIS